MLGLIGKGILLAIDTYVVVSSLRWLWGQAKSDYKAVKQFVKNKLPNVKIKTIPGKLVDATTTRVQRIFEVDDSGQVQEIEVDKSKTSSLVAQTEALGVAGA